MLFTFLCIYFLNVFSLYWYLLQNGNAAPGSKSRIPQMVANTLGFGQKHDATVDIPLDSVNVMNLLLFSYAFFNLFLNSVGQSEYIVWYNFVGS